MVGGGGGSGDELQNASSSVMHARMSNVCADFLNGSHGW